MKNNVLSLTFQDLVIYYNNEESTTQTLDEVFKELPYQFKTKKEKPLIIDAGSNIGIATLFFKKSYPNAKIICFEPDPIAFSLLQKNVAVNGLTDVELINAALSDKGGSIDFYGQIHTKNPDARGNSIIDIWGNQRDICNHIQVKSVELSSYITEEIDFLKLDIEGAEQLVLEELGDKLKWVKEIAMEFHYAEQMQHLNNLNKVKNLLEKNSFRINVIEKNSRGIFPSSIHEWAKKTDARIYAIRAIREK